MRMQVLVRLKPGVLDVQGKAVESGIAELGHVGVTNVRIGRLIELEVDAADVASGEKTVRQLCEQLLANPIIENFEIRAA